MKHTIHEAAAQFAAEYATIWKKDCGRLGEAHEHFEVRVWDGRNIVFRALTGHANGWHRMRRMDGVRYGGYPLLSVFCTRDDDFVAAVRGKLAIGAP